MVQWKKCAYNEARQNSKYNGATKKCACIGVRTLVLTKKMHTYFGQIFGLHVLLYFENLKTCLRTGHNKPDMNIEKQKKACTCKNEPEVFKYTVIHWSFDL